MVNAISAISSYPNMEYLRVLQELMRLGISSSGNFATDKIKLEQAKNELIQKIKDKQDDEQGQSSQTLVIDITQSADTQQRNQMEIQRLGAMTIAELNRLYFGI